MLNQCQFIGRLGKDPETRYTPGGKAITSFSIACGEKWKDKNTGQPVERTEWINCVTFNKLAEISGEYLTKGSLVFVSGKMKTDKYQDKQTGQDRYSTKISVLNMKMLGGRAEAGSNPTGGRQQAAPQQQASQQSAPADSGFNDSFDDDIPF